MDRALCVYLPTWSIDLLRRRERRSESCASDQRKQERALLLAAVVNNRRIVVACCERARTKGVRPGLTVSHARALLPLEGVRIEDADPRA